MTFLRTIILFLCCSFALPMSAQLSQDFNNFSKDTIKLRSDFLDEVQTLHLFFPPGYSQASKTYPVIYLLNGLQEDQLSRVKNLPEAIIVMLDNTSVKKDFKASQKEVLKNVNFDRSSTYMSFLEKELRYFMDSHYKASGNNILVGNSYDALLALEILWKRPDVFNNYVLIDPVLDVDKKGFLDQRPTRPNEMPVVFFAAKEGNRSNLQPLHDKLKNSFYKESSLHLKEFSEKDLTVSAMDEAFKLMSRSN